MNCLKLLNLLQLVLAMTKCVSIGGQQRAPTGYNADRVAEDRERTIALNTSDWVRESSLLAA
jgi:hypothetical protein